MTLVIACKSKEGIIIASDGYGKRYVPGVGNTSEIVDDAKKIFDFHNCSLLAFGAGVEDYDEFLKDLTVFVEGPIDYDFLQKNLTTYLSRKYDSDIYFSENICLILAGIDKDSQQRIGVFQSISDKGVGFHFSESHKDYYCGGRVGIADSRFGSRQDFAQENADEVALLAKESIIETSKQPGIDVNDNVTVKLITQEGIKTLD